MLNEKSDYVARARVLLRPWLRERYLPMPGSVSDPLGVEMDARFPHDAIKPLPPCMAPGFYSVYDPDHWRHGPRRHLSSIDIALVLASAFLFLTFGLRPAMGVFLGVMEMLGHHGM